MLVGFRNKENLCPEILKGVCLRRNDCLLCVGCRKTQFPVSFRGTGVVESFLRGQDCHRPKRSFQVWMKNDSKATCVDRWLRTQRAVGHLSRCQHRCITSRIKCTLYFPYSTYKCFQGKVGMFKWTEMNFYPHAIARLMRRGLWRWLSRGVAFILNPFNL